MKPTKKSAKKGKLTATKLEKKVALRATSVPFGIKG
jgi:hypothetical protein